MVMDDACLLECFAFILLRSPNHQICSSVASSHHQSKESFSIKQKLAISLLLTYSGSNIQNEGFLPWFYRVKSRRQPCSVGVVGVGICARVDDTVVCSIESAFGEYSRQDQQTLSDVHTSTSSNHCLHGRFGFYYGRRTAAKEFGRVQELFEAHHKGHSPCQ